MPRALAALLATALVALGGCGGETPDPKPRTATTQREAQPVPETVGGVDVEAVGRARDRFVEICRIREGSPAKRDDEALTREMRQSVSALIRAFRVSPDKPFKRSPGVPAVTMRERLRAAALVAQRSCGGGTGAAQARRLLREVAARDPE